MDLPGSERRATDPPGGSVMLDEQLETPLLGVPVRYRSNSAAVMELARHIFGRWRDLPSMFISVGPSVCVDIVVHAPEPGDPEPPPGGRLLFRTYGDTVVAAAGANMLTARMAEGHALAFVTPALAADEPALYRNVLERLGLLLVSYRDRTPITAAAVVRNGHAILLVGERESGRSMLCYACVRAGFGLLAEATLYVSLAEGLRVWGYPELLYLPPDSVRLFPELAHLQPLPQPDSTVGLAVDIATLGYGRPLIPAHQVTVCLVTRGAGRASRLEPVEPATAVAALSISATPGFNMLQERASAAVAALTSGATYRLMVGTDPTTAVALLEQLVENSG